MPVGKDKRLKWFGSALAHATGESSVIPHSPFPADLRSVIEPHIVKCRVKRQQALDAIKTVTGEETFDETMLRFRTSGMADEAEFSFDTCKLRLFN